MATKRHEPKEREQWAARWQASGLSGREFARRHGLQVESIYRWGREFPEAQQKRAGFSEVRLVPSQNDATSTVEVLLANGRIVRVRGEVDAQLLRAVVEAVEV